MSATISAVAAVNGAGKSGTSNAKNLYSINALKQWSFSKKYLPDVASITNIHVYDFDNTLFASPLPNKKLWSPAAVGALQGKDVFAGGGWWHDPEVLAMTGEGVAKEELRGWQGWWNEKIVELVKMSMEQEDALTILLTGRSQKEFGNLIQRMVASRSLDFDLLCLKPDIGPNGGGAFSSTMKFKQSFLSHLVQAYPHADELRIYEDRIGHVEQFRNFFDLMNNKYPVDPSNPSNEPRKKPINCEVVEVPALDTFLDPDDELMRVRAMCRAHNDSITNAPEPPKNAKIYRTKKHVHFTAYIIPPEDGERLLKLGGFSGYKSRDGYMHFANSIIITARNPAPENVMQKVGGLWAKLRWRVIALGNYDNKVFAARVQPVPLESPFYVEANVPHVVIATVGPQVRSADANRIQSWNKLPEDSMIEFETTVAEKITLRLESDPYSATTNNNGKRPADNHQNAQALHQKDNNNSRRQSGNHNHSRGGGNADAGHGGGRKGNSKGNKHGGGGGGGGKHPPRGPANAGKKGGGRGNFANYRSLDDVGASGHGTGGFGGDGSNDGGLSY